MATEKALGQSSRRTGLADLLKELRGQDCRVELDGQVHKHGDISVKLKVHNDSSSTRNIKLRMYANGKHYHGTTGEEIEEFRKEISVPAKTCELILLNKVIIMWCWVEMRLYFDSWVTIH